MFIALFIASQRVTLPDILTALLALPIWAFWGTEAAVVWTVLDIISVTCAVIEESIDLGNSSIRI